MGAHNCAKIDALRACDEIGEALRCRPSDRLARRERRAYRAVCEERTMQPADLRAAARKGITYSVAGPNVFRQCADTQCASIMRNIGSFSSHAGFTPMAQPKTQNRRLPIHAAAPYAAFSIDPYFNGYALHGFDYRNELLPRFLKKNCENAHEECRYYESR
jgi:hypothetical protein